MPGARMPCEFGPTSRVFVALKRLPHADHIQHRHPLGYANDKRYLRLDGFDQGACGVCRRNEDDARIGVARSLGVADGIEHRQIERRTSSLTRRYPGDDLSAIGDHALGMIAACVARHALAYNPCIPSD